MGLTALQAADGKVSFQRVREAHHAMLAQFPAYQECLATEDPEGYFEIDFRGAIPQPPEPGAMELEHFAVTGFLGKSWAAGAAIYDQLLSFANCAERRSATWSMSVNPEMIDPASGAKGWMRLSLPELRTEPSKVEITFFETPGTPSFDPETRIRCVEAILRPTFPDLRIGNTELGFVVTAGDRSFAFSPRHQTFTGEVVLPWPLDELVERLPLLLPAQWKPRPTLDWFISYNAPGLRSEDYYAGWRYVSEHIGPTPKGFISLDFKLRSIEGLETIRAGAKQRRGVPIGVGTFTWGKRERGSFVARVFPDGYILEIQTRTPDDMITSQIEEVVGMKFVPVSRARVV
jgi:hypothetical protein